MLDFLTCMSILIGEIVLFSYFVWIVAEAWFTKSQKSKDIEKACEEFEEAITQLGIDYHMSDEVMDKYCLIFKKHMEE